MRYVFFIFGLVSFLGGILENINHHLIDSVDHFLFASAMMLEAIKKPKFEIVLRFLWVLVGLIGTYRALIHDAPMWLSVLWVIAYFILLRSFLFLMPTRKHNTRPYKASIQA
jgi:hypothetical protein